MHSLRNKIVIYFTTLVISVIAITLLSVFNKSKELAYKNIQEELQVGARVLKEKLLSRQVLLQSAGNAISKDFYFQQLLISALEEEEENQSLATALLNQQKRADADISMVFDEEGQLIVGGQTELFENWELSKDVFVNQLSDKPDLVLVMYDNKAFQLVISPIKAPLTIGWLGLGYAIDETFVNYIKQITNLEISLLLGQSTTNKTISATTLTDNEALAFLDESSWKSYRGSPDIFVVSRKEYLSYSQVYELVSSGSVQFVFQRDIQKALVDFETLTALVTFIAVVSIFLAVAGAFSISSSITRPITELVQIAKRIGAGEYSLSINIKDKGETGELAKEFRTMQSQVAEREEKINYLAFHDAFTGLPNRNHFEQYIKDFIAEDSKSTSFVLVAVCIDRLREINDTLGHDAGDELVKQVGEKLQTLEGCGSCSIIGNDQFFIIFPDHTESDIDLISQRILVLSNESVKVKNVALDVHIRAGATIYPSHSEKTQTLMQYADIAVGVSEIKNTFFSIYAPSSNQNSIERLALMSELRSAIGRDELTLYYQPKLDLKTSVVTHVECLVRWIHPEQGFVNPDQFIPYAEQTGSIRALTRWVVETAISQHAKWLKLGWDIKVAVNISTVDLLDPKLPIFITETLERYSVPASALVLEITESAVMSDPEKAMETIDHFSCSGFKLSIDDYGTGYSSMTQLKRLNVDELKIDRSFVMDLPNNKEDEIIVRSTIDLGHNMGLSVVAEGIESQEAMDVLREWGCDLAQGYHISRPAPEEQINEWLSNCPYEIVTTTKPSQNNASSS